MEPRSTCRPATGASGPDFRSKTSPLQSQIELAEAPQLVGVVIEVTLNELSALLVPLYAQIAGVIAGAVLLRRRPPVAVAGEVAA